MLMFQVQKILMNFSYGIKIFWACDSETNYPLRGFPYLGREQTGPRPATENNVSVGSTTVMKLVEDYKATEFISIFQKFKLAFNLLVRESFCSYVFAASVLLNCTVWKNFSMKGCVVGVY